MGRSLTFITKIITFTLLTVSSFIYPLTNNPPSIIAVGRQAFCVGSKINIVTDFSITDPDPLNTSVTSFFIQISSAYQANFDVLELTGNHPNITTTWNLTEGKLTLLPAVNSAEISFSNLENAVKDVIFSTTSTDFIVEKKISLSIAGANYLPATDHFYEFVSAPAITWKDAKIEAENRDYYGRQGYLATLTNQEEADFAGKQSSEPGWIGGSDEETEGVWKWVTGPEAGTIFWNGVQDGTTPNFAFWNLNEPNNFRGKDPDGENYAHITDPTIGIRGAWNDLPNAGGTESVYIPKGYIVEYGMPNDLPLDIVATTSIYSPKIVATTNANLCESNIATITASSDGGKIVWFDAQTGGTQVASGNSYTTPILSETTVFYATISLNGCFDSLRIPVPVIVNQKPTIISTTNGLTCASTATLSATSSVGDILWYDSLTSTTPIFTGNSYTTEPLSATKTYYVEANIFGCISLVRTAITATVDTTIPEFDIVQDAYLFCGDAEIITLETINALDSYSYIWKKDGNIIAGELENLSINTSGIYTVIAVSEAGCESVEKTINVVTSETATITKDDIRITEDSNNNTIEITNTNLGIGDYEFTLDDEFGFYQSDTFFQYLSPGIHTLYIRDKIGCGITEYQFSILSFPKFFTPNQDGHNDTWKISGFDKTFYTSSDIFIYNRYGNLIFKIDENNQSWDGNFQGKKLHPNSYWYTVTLTDINGRSTEKTGSFSLIWD